MDEKKKICVVSMENHTGHLLYIVAHANHVEYCRRNGYEYYEANDFSKYPERDHAHWYKFPVIHDAMQSHPDMDYYLWIDMDAVFTNMDERLEQFIPDGDAQILMSNDCKGGRHGSLADRGYCSGVVMLRNTELVRSFIEELSSELMYNLGQRCEKAGIIHYRDQDMITFLAQVGCYKGIITDISGKGFQSYINNMGVDQWDKGDCILHLCGHGFGGKLDILKKIGYDLSTGEVGLNGRP